VTADVVARAWVGVDVGKTHHWICAVDADGRIRLSVKVANDESEINAVIERVRSLAVEVVWAVDIIAAPSALLLTMLARAGQVAGTHPGGSWPR
jgi:Transposase